MLGYMNKCPNCGEDSSFVPESMECDNALVVWCRHCGNFINLTLTMETIRRWWVRVDDGEESIAPPISRESMEELLDLQERLNEMNSGILEKIEIHIKDFADYRYTEDDEGNGDS
ncbi:hypothetical protein [Paenibacillus massiliensis]|uniref:hypothetical protein n=1 Tax=Paenibacillus massiliensis TaxID=225917 RepID=UPI000362C260|nr:hypothetical protein [Paenibacillus massiliensis]